MQVYLASAKAASSKNAIRCPKEPLWIESAVPRYISDRTSSIDLGWSVVKRPRYLPIPTRTTGIELATTKSSQNSLRVKVLSTVPVVSNGDQGN